MKSRERHIPKKKISRKRSQYSRRGDLKTKLNKSEEIKSLRFIIFLSIVFLLSYLFFTFVIFQ